MGRTIPPCPGDEPVTATPLSSWLQIAPRDYIRVVLCFPFHNDRKEAATAHLADALLRLSSRRPHFAARLQLDLESGRVYLRQIPSDTIPFSAKSIENECGYTYDELRSQHFPARAFIHDRYSQPAFLTGDGFPVPACVVQAFFLDGGLLLSVFLHHCIADGHCLGLFLDMMACTTRNVPFQHPSSMKLRFPCSVDGVVSDSPDDHSSCRLFQNCPEYTFSWSRSGPTQPLIIGEPPLSQFEKAGKIFVFNHRKLNELRKLMMLFRPQRKPPSSYVLLAALTWAHTARARAMANSSRMVRPSGTGRLMNPINWRTRVPAIDTANYFGSSVVWGVTDLPKCRILGSADHHMLLADLMEEIDKSINAVDEEYVLHRSNLFEALPDPRLLGLKWDTRQPLNLGFNTWRHFGAATEWSIPGVTTSSPDAIRKPQDGWSLGTALVLPARPSNTAIEVMIGLPADAMENLCKDQNWMQWVESVIE